MLEQYGPTTGSPAACAAPQCFRWPQEAFRKMVKSEICGKMCEGTFAELLAQAKVHLCKNKE